MWKPHSDEILLSVLSLPGAFTSSKVLGILVIVSHLLNVEFAAETREEFGGKHMNIESHMGP